jgi:dihydroorotase/N-acyl-D-amino-acid deacylase
MSNRILFTNTWLADGSLSPLRKGSLLIDGERILDLGENLHAGGAKQIDCTDLLIAPGFIDAHSHSDLQVLYNKPEKIKQGVTSEVVGNCGFSPYPNAHPDDLHEFGNGILYGHGEWGWKSAADYLLAIHERAKLASVASLVGHGSLRIAHAGLTQGPTDEPTLAAMEGTLDDALAEGATGFSTGLMYAPGSSAPREELVRLCKVVAKRNKIYCTHMRDYSTHLLDAIDEQIDLARAAECKLQISHLQTVGRDNWKLNALALERLEKARESGLDVMFDCYPYVAGSTVLTQLLPQWALEGGIPKLSERLSEASFRREIERQILDKMVHEWSDIFISAVNSQANADVVGKSLAEISVERGDSPLNIAFSLLLEEQGKVNMLQFNQSEENLHANLAHPLSIIISDGFYVKGKPHPRLHGTFPELLGNVCRDKGWLSLTEAIHKVTGSPADRFSFKDRGVLKPGSFADITIFDQATIRSNSTYKDPELDPSGVLAVFREGRLLLGNDHRFTLN